MNAHTAKRLRRIAQEEGRFYQGPHKYYEVSLGPKTELTIRCRPDSVRGIYKALKRGLRMARLNARSGAAPIATRRRRILDRRKTQAA